jgi:glycosyltransferase involved in cell wall biosynthesis
MALAPGRDVAQELPVIVVGSLRTASGLGQSARLCYRALASAGVPVLGVDVSADFMQPQDIDDFEFADARVQGGDGPGTIILHVNAPFVAFALLRIGRRILRNKYVVGYWQWELPKAPPEWINGAKFVHEIWVPSTFVARAVADIAEGRSIRIVPHPVAAAYASSDREVPAAAAFTVLTIFNTASSFARKNVLASIAAFRTAFGSDPSACLIVKNSHPASAPDAHALLKAAVAGAPNITLINSVVDASAVHALYRESQVLLSLHRAEGFGLTLAEAMLHKRPVVATGWSGNVDFLTAETGIPVPYRLVRAADDQQTYNYPTMHWADADVNAAAVALRSLRENPRLATRLSESGAAFAATEWSVGKYAKRVGEALKF